MCENALTATGSYENAQGRFGWAVGHLFALPLNSGPNDPTRIGPSRPSLMSAFRPAQQNEMK
jgi:hypothetical protein